MAQATNTGAPDVVAEDLTKVYANGVKAADAVSLAARAGEVVGVVGPNGAGKSTTLGMLATLLAPTSGDGRVCGIPIGDVDRVRPLLGVALQSVGLDPLMTGSEHFAVQAALYEVPRDVARRRRDELVERFTLGAQVGRPAGQLSGGTQRRLALALALVNDPPVVIFDEPTAGLDPRSRRDLWRLVEELRDEGRVVLLSTQYLEEADRLCDCVHLIDDGRIVLSGPPAQLRHQVGSATLRLKVTAHPQVALDVLRAEVPKLEPNLDGEAVVCTLNGDVSAAGDVLAAVRSRGLSVQSLSVEEPTLDDVFLQYTGRAIDAEPLSGGGFDIGARMQRGGGKKWR